MSIPKDSFLFHHFVFLLFLSFFPSLPIPARHCSVSFYFHVHFTLVVSRALRLLFLVLLLLCLSVLLLSLFFSAPFVSLYVFFSHPSQYTPSLYFSVIGDQIILSATALAMLEREKLTLTELHCEELSESEHVSRVIALPDYVPSVSIHHELNMVEPDIADLTVSSLTSVPPPLAQSVLGTFKRWYHDRLPLRLTREHGDQPMAKWQEFEAMLEPMQSVTKVAERAGA